MEMVNCKQNIKETDEVFNRVLEASKPDWVIEPFPAGKRENNLGKPTLVQAYEKRCKVIGTFKSNVELKVAKEAMGFKNNRKSFVINDRAILINEPCETFYWRAIATLDLINQKILVFIDPMGFQREIFFLIGLFLDILPKVTDKFMILLYLPFKVTRSKRGYTTKHEYESIFREEWNGDKMKILNNSLNYFNKLGLDAQEIHRCTGRVKASFIFLRPKYPYNININELKDETVKNPFYHTKTQYKYDSEIDKLLRQLHKCPKCLKPKPIGKKTCTDYHCRGWLIHHKKEWYDLVQRKQLSLETYL